MADGKQGVVTLRGAFPAGTRVELHNKSVDWFAGQGRSVRALSVLGLPEPAAVAKVDGQSEASFDGLPHGRPFWAVGVVNGRVRARSVLAKIPVADQPRVVGTVATGGRVDVAEPHPSIVQNVAPGQAEPVNRATRDTRNRAGHRKMAMAPADPHAGDPDVKVEGTQERAAADGVPQASSTVTGSSAPVAVSPAGQHGAAQAADAAAEKAKRSTAAKKAAATRRAKAEASSGRSRPKRPSSRSKSGK